MQKASLWGTVINLNSDGFRNNMNLKFDSKNPYAWGLDDITPWERTIHFQML